MARMVATYLRNRLNLKGCGCDRRTSDGISMRTTEACMEWLEQEGKEVIGFSQKLTKHPKREGFHRFARWRRELLRNASFKKRHPVFQPRLGKAAEEIWDRLSVDEGLRPFQDHSFESSCGQIAFSQC